MRRTRRKTAAVDQRPLFDQSELAVDDAPSTETPFELERALRSMTLETSSNVYAVRRATW